MVSLDRIARRLDVDLIAGQAQLFEASEVTKAMGRSPSQRGLVSVDPARAALVLGVRGENVASVSRFLVDAYSTDAACHLLDTAVDDEPPMAADLGQLRSLVQGDTEAAIWVAAADPYLAGRSAETLARVVARLRAPGGCPWDQKQTSQSLREDIADEAWEVMDAIDNGDDRNLAEELGDVLMSVVLQAQIAEDEGRFTLADVYEGVNAKLVRRHPHVFGDTKVSGTDDIVANWNRIKAEEKVEAGIAPDPGVDPLGRFPKSMPALAIVRELVAKGDWPGNVFIDPFGPRDVAEEAANWYAERLDAGTDPESELRAGLRRLLTADHSLRFLNSAGERTNEWDDEKDSDELDWDNI